MVEVFFDDYRRPKDMFVISVREHVLLTSHLLKYCSTPLRHRCPAAVLVHFQQKVGLRLVKTFAGHWILDGGFYPGFWQINRQFTKSIPRAQLKLIHRKDQ